MWQVYTLTNHSYVRIQLPRIFSLLSGNACKELSIVWVWSCSCTVIPPARNTWPETLNYCVVGRRKVGPFICTATFARCKLMNRAEIAQSVWRLSTCWRVRGLNSSGGNIFLFSTPYLHWLWSLPSTLYNRHRPSFPGGKSGKNVYLNVQSHLMATLRMSRRIPLLPLCKCIPFYRRTLPLQLNDICFYRQDSVVSRSDIQSNEIKDVDNFPGRFLCVWIIAS